MKAFLGRGTLSLALPFLVAFSDSAAESIAVSDVVVAPAGSAKDWLPWVTLVSQVEALRVMCSIGTTVTALAARFQRSSMRELKEAL